MNKLETEWKELSYKEFEEDIINNFVLFSNIFSMKLMIQQMIYQKLMKC